MDSRNMAKLCKNIHSHFHWSQLAPPPTMTRQLFVVDCWVQLLQFCTCLHRICRQRGNFGSLPSFKLKPSSIHATVSFYINNQNSTTNQCLDSFSFLSRLLVFLGKRSFISQMRHHNLKATCH